MHFVFSIYAGSLVNFFLNLTIFIVKCVSSEMISVYLSSCSLILAIKDQSQLLKWLISKAMLN